MVIKLLFTFRSSCMLGSYFLPSGSQSMSHLKENLLNIRVNWISFFQAFKIILHFTYYIKHTEFTKMDHNFLLQFLILPIVSNKLLFLVQK